MKSPENAPPHFIKETPSDLWLKLDDKFWRNSKMRRLSHAARGVFADSLSFCGDTEAPTGFLTIQQALDRAYGPQARRLVGELVDNGNFEPVPGGYLIHDFPDYLPKGQSRERMRIWRDAQKAAGITEAQLAALRLRVLERDGYQCRYCGKVPPRKQIVADHVIPAPQGPSTYENLVAACRSCNRRKGSLPLADSGLILRPLESHIESHIESHEVSHSPSHGVISRAHARDGTPVPVPVPVVLKAPPGDRARLAQVVRQVVRLDDPVLQLQLWWQEFRGGQISEHDKQAASVFVLEYPRLGLNGIEARILEHATWRAEHNKPPLGKLEFYRGTLSEQESHLADSGVQRPRESRSAGMERLGEVLAR